MYISMYHLQRGLCIRKKNAQILKTFNSHSFAKSLEFLHIEVSNSLL